MGPGERRSSADRNRDWLHHLDALDKASYFCLGRFFEKPRRHCAADKFMQAANFVAIYQSVPSNAPMAGGLFLGLPI
jgi:hypothetical protein